MIVNVSMIFLFFYDFLVLGFKRVPMKSESEHPLSIFLFGSFFYHHIKMITLTALKSNTTPLFNKPQSLELILQVRSTNRETGMGRGRLDINI